MKQALATYGVIAVAVQAAGQWENYRQVSTEYYHFSGHNPYTIHTYIHHVTTYILMFFFFFLFLP